MHAHENPFRIEQIHSLPYCFSDPDLNVVGLADRFLQSSELRIAALLGAHGQGKSTLLKMLSEELRRRGCDVYSYSAATDTGVPSGPQSRARVRHWSAPVLHEIRKTLAAQQRRRPTDAPIVVTVDSAELLRGIVWLKLRHAVRHVRCLVTLHQPRRIPVLHQCQPDPDVFLKQCRKLLLASESSYQPSDSELLSVYQVANQNSRDAFFQLYEQFARR